MSLQVGKFQIKTLQEIPLENQSIFCRVDLNVPIENGNVTDETRLRAILPTVQFLLEQKCKLTLASHLGRPKGKVNEKYSLLPVAGKLAERLKREIVFPDGCTGDGVRKVIKDQRPGDVVLLENLRFHPEEEANDSNFALELKNHFDAYVSDAFGSLHRAHASTEALPRFFETKCAGFLVERELKFLTPLLEAADRPYAVILGGAKVSDKVKVIENLLKKIDRILLGGAMVFTFLRAMGKKTGNSLVEEDKIFLAERILEQAKSRGVQVFLPKDFMLGRSVDEPGPAKLQEGVDIPEGWMGLDIGPETIKSFGSALQDARTIFWNGPLGLFEKPPFDQGTVGIANCLGELQCTRVIGGGDSAAAVSKAGVADQMTHISTGGGATLEFLEGQVLPGLAALSV